MYTIDLGYVKVPTPGTPVTLAAVIASYNAALPAGRQQIDANEKAHKIEFWPLLTNTGLVYVGLAVGAPASNGSPMNKATGSNVMKAVQVPASGGHQDFFIAEGSKGANDIRLADYAVDAANANEGFMVYAFKD